MYVKKTQHHHHHHHHHSFSLTSSTGGGRTSPSPIHGASNPVVLQAPVVQQIRAASCRGLAGGCGGGGGGGCSPSTVLSGSLTRNELHPLACLAAAADHNVDDVFTSNVEASLWASVG